MRRQRWQTTKRIYVKQRRQRSSFLNRYDFANAGRNIVNQVGKIARGLIKNASSEINNNAQQRISQVISQGGKEIEHVLPKILCGAIEDVYQTPFRLPGKFGKQQLQKINSKLL